MVQVVCEGQDGGSICIADARESEGLILLCAQSQMLSINTGESLPVWPRTRKGLLRKGSDGGVSGSLVRVQYGGGGWLMERFGRL